MRTLHNAVLAVQALSHNPYNFDGTTDGDPVDLAAYGNDFRDVDFVLWVDSASDGTFEFTVQDYNADTDEYEDVDAEHLIGEVPTLDGTDSSIEYQCFQFGYKPYGRQYVRVRVVSSDTDDGTRFGVVALLGNGCQSPPLRS